MAGLQTVLILVLTWLLITCGCFFREAVSQGSVGTWPSQLISRACTASRFPNLCVSSLAGCAESATADAVELTRIAISLSLRGLSNNFAEVNHLVSTVTLDVNASGACAVCLDALDGAATHLGESQIHLGVYLFPEIQARLSGALALLYDCYSALFNVFNPPSEISNVALPSVNNTQQLISIALAMTNALATYGPAVDLWQPAPEHRPTPITSYNSYPQWLSTNDSCYLQSSLVDLTGSASLIVSKDASSPLSSIQQAVDSAPTFSNQRFIIYIKQGVYEEIVRIHKNKTNIMFVGDGSDKTIITGNMYSRPGTPTYLTATVVTIGKGFLARGVTFQNTAGPSVHQAVAIRVDSDTSAFQDCVFDGYQDTLYAHTMRQFYKDCTIMGTVDFVFGNSAAVFQHCLILIRVGLPGQAAVLTAQGRTDPGQSTAFLFQNCSVTGTPDYLSSIRADLSQRSAYLGRPWKQFSRCIFLFTFIDLLINHEGWLPWSADFALDSLYYGEYGNYGPGANLSGRVWWSNQLSVEQANLFTVPNFIQGNCWLPSTSIPYSSY